MDQSTQIMPPEQMAELVARSVSQTHGVSSDQSSVDVPEQIGKYPVSKCLGQGGMGIVYLAQHPELDMPVAIKIIRRDCSVQHDNLERFLQEARLVSRLNHPNVVRIYDIDYHEGCPFIVQEYVEGGDLSQRIAQSSGRGLDIAESLRIVQGLASALTAFQEMEIVHRDIKPANILLTAEGEPKLSDLGVAKQIGQEQLGLTQASFSMGSPLFMAPEQIGDSRSVDARADIYALGVTFYQMLTGELPFAASSMLEMADRHRYERLQDPRDINPAVPRRLAAVVMRMLARNRNERYENATSLLADLEQVRICHLPGGWLKACAAIVLTGILGLGLFSLSGGFGKGSPIGQVESYLAMERYDEALPLLKQMVEKEPRNLDARYALGLCYARLDQSEALQTLIEELETIRNGQEYARHLQITSLVTQNRLQEAGGLIAGCESDVSHKLPFLLSKGHILLEANQPEAAEEVLEQAISQASFFDFQRLQAFDSLAKLFLRRGNAQGASRLYAQGLQNARADGTTIPPAYLTNYSLAQLKAGETRQARKTLQQTLDLHPQDEMAIYLNKRATEVSQQLETTQMAQTMSLINDLNDDLKNRKQSADVWQGSPVILLVLNAESIVSSDSALGREEFWEKRLLRALQEEGTFPVVDRDALSHLLTEQKLAASELGDGAIRLQLGQLWPASVLVKPLIEVYTSYTEVSVKLIDVQTSEVVDVVSQRFRDGDKAADMLNKLCTDLVRTLRGHRRMTSGLKLLENNRLDLRMGSYHGLMPGQEILVYKKPNAGMSLRSLLAQPPLVKASVVSLDRFTAIAEVVQPASKLDPAVAGSLLAVEAE